ncbi:hypothetical protein JOB18_033509 [Solea senegalensis]|uniref:Uncharacterized protein n=1 Tax=Solea senegalensis TaxID=28829 RepID=A0AAV6QAZ2_SOLSE|nr:hypothetical protein JOB18_033509 [Solea senegalensis]
MAAEWWTLGTMCTTIMFLSTLALLLRQHFVGRAQTFIPHTLGRSLCLVVTVTGGNLWELDAILSRAGAGEQNSEPHRQAAVHRKSKTLMVAFRKTRRRRERPACRAAEPVNETLAQCVNRHLPQM